VCRYRSTLPPPRMPKEEFKVFHPPYYAKTEQACYAPGTDLSRGTSAMRDEVRWVEFFEELQIDEGRGKSHRWRYNFAGAPSFLKCHWTGAGDPIRPLPVQQENLLDPEAIHEDVGHYIGAILAMIVDNPINAHTVNHVMHRYCISREWERLIASGNQMR
jgi:hypothetical protein